MKMEIVFGQKMSLLLKQLFLYRSIFWPGGQAICRYIFDLGNANFVEGKRVLDIGCGCGAAAIGAVLAGAKKPVVANDVDKVGVNLEAFNFEINRYFKY